MQITDTQVESQSQQPDNAANANSSPKAPFLTPKPKLSRKQQIFVKEYIDTNNATEAAVRAYDVKDRKVAQAVGSENLSKPIIQSALINYNDLVESALINTISDWKDSDKPRQREIAMDVAKFAHDKIHGRAKQQIQVQANVVSINLNLTGDGEQPPDDL